MDQPPGFEVSVSGVSAGFHASKTDNSLFIQKSPENILLLMVYVDDIVKTGIEVQQMAQGLLFSQKKYVSKILNKTRMLDAAATPNPMVSTPKLTTTDNSPLFLDAHLYQSTVGMLQCLCITRPNLSFYVNKLSQYMNLPSENHWKAVKRVLKYLSGTIDHGLYFSKGQAKVVCYSDADWASSVEDRRSTTGYAMYLGPNLVAWSSKKQVVVSRSSSEAEYHSLANYLSDLLWV
ncbi:secreted RxLR effector protein 161-like [Gossypium hirsutum]|uniref:Secreted RxLR effector protein 161-like n=1 Tax=Gossypium hirsutum TaxID=3635 RepID=A0A1U8MUE8_GOSHI|nr:secreted RxLR effector protein 161-like [Gossypium hirsutum]